MTEYRSLADAKARLSEVIDHVEAVGEHVIITRRGKPAAVVISVDEYEGLIDTLDLYATPGAVEEIKEADSEIERGQYLTAEQLRAEFLKKK